jgi:hypothetical protein
MSFLARTPICPASLSTDLGKAFQSHEATYRGDKTFRLPNYEVAWLNVMRDRARKQSDATLTDATDKMLALLLNPQAAGHSFQETFSTLHDDARRHAYPLCSALLDEKVAFSGLSLDYTLACIDLGLVRVLEDRSLTDQTVRSFVADMLRIHSTGMSVPRYEILRRLFDVYSEAIVYHLLQERGGTQLKIDKIKETKDPTPDFKCTLSCDINGDPRELEFYIELKSLDIVHAPYRLPEMLDTAMDAQIEIERQRRAGKSVVMVENEIEPHRPYGAGEKYDPMSVRQVVETLIEKASNNFKATQFALGPTFALANLLRLPLPGQGANALAPSFYDPSNGGACISGVFWHMAFGEFDTPIQRRPEFEGAGTLDGNLQKAGLLVKSAVAEITPGLITFYHDQAAYRFSGLYDSRWKNALRGWSNLETEVVLELLCGDYNSKDNSMAHSYSLHRE